MQRPARRRLSIPPASLPVQVVDVIEGEPRLSGIQFTGSFQVGERLVRRVRPRMGRIRQQDAEKVVGPRVVRIAV